MAVIVKGSCIGIKFRRINNEEYCSHTDSTGQFCIHNGRFMYAFLRGGVEVPSINTDHLSNVESVVFQHAGTCRNGLPDFNSIGVFHVADVRLVPAFSYIYKDFRNPNVNVDIHNYCTETRPGSDYYDDHRNDTDKILPTMPIAFCYTRPDGRRDVHNGRYMYWQDNSLRRHCVLRLTDKPYRLWYSHMIFDGNGNLTPELRYRENIIGFRKIPST